MLAIFALLQVAAHSSFVVGLPEGLAVAHVRIEIVRHLIASLLKSQKREQIEFNAITAGAHSLNAYKNTLFRENNSLKPSQKFPVLMGREFARNSLNFCC